MEIQIKQWTESGSFIDGFHKAFDGFNHNVLAEQLKYYCLYVLLGSIHPLSPERVRVF